VFLSLIYRTSRGVTAVCYSKYGWCPAVRNYEHVLMKRSGLDVTCTLLQDTLPSFVLNMCEKLRITPTIMAEAPPEMWRLPI